MIRTAVILMAVLLLAACALLAAGQAFAGGIAGCVAAAAGAGAVVLSERRQATLARELAGAQARAAESAAAGESASQRLTQCRTMVQRMINALPHGVALITPSGAVEMLNDRAELFGLRAGEPAGAVQHLWLRAIIEEAIRTRQPATVPADPDAAGRKGSRPGVVQMFEEGRELFFKPEVTPLIDAGGALAGVCLVLAEMTEALRADEVKANLMSSFSHDLKTPMTSLQMSIYLLIDDAATRLTPRQMELLKSARDDLDRLHRLMEEMLARARSGATGRGDR